jgi:hypothetical protein
MGVRCENCRNDLVLGYYYQWLKLDCFIDFLRMENYIEAQTHEEMLDCLMAFKELALSADEANKDTQ